MKDQFGAISLFAKRMGGNAFKYVDFRYDSASSGIKLFVNIYLLSDSMIRTNNQFKSRGNIVIFNTYLTTSVTCDFGTVRMDPKTFLRIQVPDGYRIKINKDNYMGKLKVTSKEVALGNKYFFTGENITPYMATQGLAGGLAYSLDAKYHFTKLDENMANIFMKIYKQVHGW